MNFREFKEARKARREKYPRLALALSVLGAAASTYAALPAPGKHIRLVIVLTIIATWAAVVISAVKLAAARRRNRMEQEMSTPPYVSGGS